MEGPVEVINGVVQPSGNPAPTSTGGQTATKKVTLKQQLFDKKFTIGLSALGGFSSYAIAKTKGGNSTSWAIGGVVVGAVIGFLADNAWNKQHPLAN